MCGPYEGLLPNICYNELMESRFTVCRPILRMKQKTDGLHGVHYNMRHLSKNSQRIMSSYSSRLRSKVGG